jgi:hypothetical protein
LVRTTAQAEALHVPADAWNRRLAILEPSLPSNRRSRDCRAVRRCWLATGVDPCPVEHFTLGRQAQHDELERVVGERRTRLVELDNELCATKRRQGLGSTGSPSACHQPRRARRRSSARRPGEPSRQRRRGAPAGRGATGYPVTWPGRRLASCCPRSTDIATVRIERVLPGCLNSADLVRAACDHDRGDATTVRNLNGGDRVDAAIKRQELRSRLRGCRVDVREAIDDGRGRGLRPRIAEHRCRRATVPNQSGSERRAPGLLTACLTERILGTTARLALAARSGSWSRLSSCGRWAWPPPLRTPSCDPAFARWAPGRQGLDSARPHRGATSSPRAASSAGRVSYARSTA